MNNINRRQFVSATAGMLITAPGLARASSVRLPFDNGERPLVQLPQKRPLIGLTMRPPQLETPFEIFNQGLLTPNDAFFVRYHLSGLPTTIDPAQFRLTIGGHVGKPLSLSLAALKRDFPRQELVAVNQCSGNSRGFSDPRVGGGQLGNGAMGNARWLGVPLKALLDRAGVQQGARQVTFNGLDTPPADSIPDFIKGARHRPCPRWRGHGRLGHERGRPALPQRLSAAPHRAGLLWHLLGQASPRDQCRRCAI
jgi:DMSO/TMAO reductase YedYZ molybdopterin-dependent catalytic subunit